MAYLATDRIQRHGTFRTNAAVFGGHCADDDRSVPIPFLRQRSGCDGLRPAGARRARIHRHAGLVPVARAAIEKPPHGLFASCRCVEVEALTVFF